MKPYLTLITVLYPSQPNFFGDSLPTVASLTLHSKLMSPYRAKFKTFNFCFTFSHVGKMILWTNSFTSKYYLVQFLTLQEISRLLCLITHSTRKCSFLLLSLYSPSPIDFITSFTTYLFARNFQICIFSPDITPNSIYPTRY